LSLIALYLLSIVFLLVSLAVFLGGGFLLALVFADVKDILVMGGALTGSLVGTILMTIAIAAFFSAVCDDTLNVREALGRGWHMFWPFLWLMCLVAYIIQGGILLFVIPGIIFLVWFFPSQFIIFTEEDRGMNALLKGRAYVSGNFWDVLLRLFILCLLSWVAGMVPLIGMIFFAPFMFIYMYLVYQELRDIKGDKLSFATSAGTKLKWIGVSTVGYILPIVLIFAFVGPSLMTAYQWLKTTGDKGTASFKLQAESPSLVLDRTSFGPRDIITVRFTASSTYDSDAWVGIIPSGIEHGSESENDRHDISYQYLNKRTSGELTFTAPATPGSYDFRMHDTDSGGKEVTYVTFSVEGSVMQQDSFVRTLKDFYTPGEPIEIEYSSLPGNRQDWITLVESSAPENTYGEWFYTGGKTSGRHTFSAKSEGEYEIRLYFDWPSGGYNVMSRYAFSVSGGGGSDQLSDVPSGEPSFGLDRTSFSPGERITVLFTAPSSYANNAWVGIIPSHVPHGNETENDRHDISYQYINKRTSGEMTFSAPSNPGNYDFRMHDTDSGGREVTYVTFSVGKTSSYITPSQPMSVKESEVYVYIYSLNYKGKVKFNGEDYYVIKGERDMNYNFNSSVKLREGRNVFELQYESLPDPWNTEFKLKVYRYGSGSQAEEVLGEWVVSDQGGSITFEITIGG
jgi:fatty acid-binding protein DegV